MERDVFYFLILVQICFGIFIISRFFFFIKNKGELFFSIVIIFLIDKYYYIVINRICIVNLYIVYYSDYVRYFEIKLDGIYSFIFFFVNNKYFKYCFVIFIKQGYYLFYNLKVN